MVHAAHRLVERPALVVERLEHRPHGLESQACDLGQRADQPQPLDVAVVVHRSRGTRRLAVRNKEFELLAYFLRHPGKVLEPRVLLEAVWGYPYLGDANLVQVTLRRLRQELEAGGAPRLIQTVPRGGYVLRLRDDGLNGTPDSLPETPPDSP